MTQPDLFDPNAERRRDTGIAAAVEHADREIAEWSDRAIGLVREFALGSDRPFLTEDVRHWVRLTHELPEPPDGRAWGAVMRRAKLAGYIIPAGYRAARSSNLSPKVLWTRAV